MNRVSIGPDNGLSPIRRQATIWTNAGLLLIGTLGTNFSEILIVIHKFPCKKMQLKMSFGKWRPFCTGGDESTVIWHLPQNKMLHFKIFLWFFVCLVSSWNRNSMHNCAAGNQTGLALSAGPELPHESTCSLHTDGWPPYWMCHWVFDKNINVSMKQISI